MIIAKALNRGLRLFSNALNFVSNPRHFQQKKNFQAQSEAVIKKHFSQTKEIVEALNKKYEKPIFGRVHTTDLFDLLGKCVDPVDASLGGVSQLIHSLQTIESMENEGIKDRDFLFAGLVHDMGKLLLLMDEVPENIVCMNAPIGTYERGIGLDQCVLQWNHDEFIYSRLKHYLPEHISWLLRYHSMFIVECEPFMNDLDREYTERYLQLFRRHDRGSKSVYSLPTKKIEDYKDLIRLYLPESILF